MKQNSSTQTEEKSSKLGPKQVGVIFMQELRFSFFGVCLIEVSCKSTMWNFLDEESALYFRFLKNLKEKKTVFESSFLKKAEKKAYESRIIKKNFDGRSRLP